MQPQKNQYSKPNLSLRLFVSRFMVQSIRHSEATNASKLNKFLDEVEIEQILSF